MTKKTTKEEQIKELTATVQRVQADFENYKKRTEKETQEYKKYSNEELITRILPIIDNFELALKHNHAQDEFAKGIELIYAQLITTLKDEGIKAIKAEGQNFNPEIHEALLQEHSKQEKDKVIEELQKGYTLNDKVIRPTKVKISKGPEVKKWTNKHKKCTWKQKQSTNTY